jgi:hypothetical protein
MLCQVNPDHAALSKFSKIIFISTFAQLQQITILKLFLILEGLEKSLDKRLETYFATVEVTGPHTDGIMAKYFRVVKEGSRESESRNQHSNNT